MDANIITSEAVSIRLERIRERIEASGGDPGVVTVVAVTKGFTRLAVDAALDAGLDDVGENYAQELLSKAGGSNGCRGGSSPRWHFLGAVQRNKVRGLAPVVDCWQTVCRLAEGEQIAARVPGARVLVEIDASERAGRNGCRPHEVGQLVSALSDLDLDIAGVMTVAPRGVDPARRAFRQVRRLADDLGLRERSMGMSDDLELAVSEGSTMVRIGRALFGERPPRRREAPGASL